MKVNRLAPIRARLAERAVLQAEIGAVVARYPEPGWFVRAIKMHELASVEHGIGIFAPMDEAFLLGLVDILLRGGCSSYSRRMKFKHGGYVPDPGTCWEYEAGRADLCAHCLVLKEAGLI